MDNRLSLFCDRVIEAGWLASAVTVPLFFNVFSSRVFEPDKLTLLRSIVFIMAAAWLIKIASSPRPNGFSVSKSIRSSPLTLAVLVFAVVYLLATAVSVTPRTSFWGSYVRLQGTVSNLAYLTLFFLVAYNLRTRDQINRLMGVIIVTSIPISLYGVIQHFKLDPLPWGGDVTFRVTSTMGNAIFLAAYLIMVVPLTLVRLVQAVAVLLQAPADKRSLWHFLPFAGKQTRLPWLLSSGYSVALALQLVTIALTLSRGPWIGLAIGLLLLALLWLWRAGKSRITAAICGLFVLLLVFTLAVNLPNSPLEPLKKASVYVERLGTILDMESGTNRVRTLIWFGDGVGKGAAGLIASEPWRTLLGHGPESMYVAYNPFYPPELAHLEARNATPDRSHNDLLDYLVITGFAGLFAYLLVMVRAFSVGIQRLWKETDLAQQGILVGILGALAAHVVESLFGIAIASTLTYTWLLLGCLSAVVMASATKAEAAAGLKPEVITTETHGDKRRRLAKTGRAKSNLPANTGQPWYKSFGFYLLAAYCILTALVILVTLRFAAPSDPQPVPLVLFGYGWLLLGILTAAVWVKRPPARGRVHSQALIIAIVVGVIAVFLPVKLFFGEIIADTYFKKGQTLASQQRFEQAVAPYIEAIQWEPDQDYYYLFLGQAYLELARTTRDERPALRLDGLNDLARLKDRPASQIGKDNLFQAALLTLKTARDLNPLNTDHSANLGRLYRLWGEVSSDQSVRREKLALSIDYFKRALRLSPNAAHLWAESGLIYYLQGDFQEALKQYQKAEDLDSLYSPTYAYLGDLYRAAGNDDAALESYKKAMEIDGRYRSLLPPQKAALHSTLGQMYFQKGLLQQSLEENLKLAQLSPRDLAVHKNLALLYRELGDRRMALDEARIALALAPPEERNSIQSFINEIQASSP